MSSSSVDDIPDQCKDLFTQDGVLLKACMGRPITDLNSIGMLCIMQNSDSSKCIEWRPLDLITIDSDTQDQEWAVVNTIGRRQRTLSGNMTSDYATARARIIRIPLEDLKSFRVTRNNQQLQLSTKPGVWQTTLYFQHGNAEVFMSNLKNHVKSAKTRHDRNTYVVVEPNSESQVLNRSFAELDIFTENTTDVVWNLVSNFKQRPYETTMEAFSKLTDIDKCSSHFGRYSNPSTNDTTTRSRTRYNSSDNKHGQSKHHVKQSNFNFKPIKLCTSSGKNNSLKRAERFESFVLKDVHHSLRSVTLFAQRSILIFRMYFS